MFKFFNKYVAYGAVFLASFAITSFAFNIESQPASRTTANTSKVQVSYTTQVLPHAYALKRMPNIHRCPPDQVNQSEALFKDDLVPNRRS